MKDLDPNYCYEDLNTALKGGDLFFNGDSTSACFGGSIPLYAPSVWQQGSSFSHFDESTCSGVQEHAMMTPFINPGEAVHEPGCSRALLSDLGYITHDFIPLPIIAATVPSLTEWGTLLLVLFMLIVGIGQLRAESRFRGIS